MNHLIFIISCLLVAGCTGGDQDNKTDTDTLSTAAVNSGEDSASGNIYRIALPGALKEISGIAFYKDSLLACVQDEEGMVFFMDPVNRKITSTLSFGEKGDYEGIAVKGEDIYVVRSDGELYRIRKPGSKDQQVDKFSLGYDYLDIEGLCLDPQTGDLLLSAKSAGKEFKKEVPVFRFSTGKGEFEKDPWITIDTEGKDGKNNFSPSDIQVDPSTGYLLFVDSPNQQWVETDREGDVKHRQKIDKDLLPQPEGIAIDSEGSVWISSEGKGGDAILIKLRREELDRLGKAPK